MIITFLYKGIEYQASLILNPTDATYNCLSVAKFQDDTRPRLQLVSRSCARQDAIKVHRLSVLTTVWLPNVGRVILSKSYKRAWINDGYCHRLKDFSIT